MILDIFSELQRAKPWADGHEAAIYRDAIAQAKLADELGYVCWWSVEHHGAVEFSYSSAPELTSLLLSQHTQRLRFGHAGVLAPFKINHPIRIAERAAVTDIASGGRFELGLARSGGTEWTAFGVDAETSRDQLREAMHMIPKMWTQDSFSWESEHLSIPERNIVPKPLQQPHPPLWQTCTSPDSFALAGEMGVGALATTLLSPLESLVTLRGVYKDAIVHAEPAGAFVNDQLAVFTFVHCAESKKEAIASRAGEALLWFVNAAPRVFQVPRAIWIDAIRGSLAVNDPAATAETTDKASTAGEADLNDPVPVIRLLNRHLAGEDLDPVEVYEVLDELEAVVIGDPDACLRKMKKYSEIGVDRLMCLMQFGALPHEQVMSSLRLVGEELLPVLTA